MSDQDIVDPAKIDKAIRSAKDSPSSFAFVQGAADNFLAVDRQKKPDQLFSLLKKQASSAKGCYGTVLFEGGAAIFICDHPISGLEKQIAEWLRRNKLSFKVRLGAVAPVVEEEDDEKSGSVRPAATKSGGKGAVVEDDDEIDEDDESDRIFSQKYLITMMRKSKAKPVNFAFGKGDKPENDLMTMHPRRAPKALAMMVKRSNGW